MSDSMRWGILGTGKIARILAQALAESATGELVAVASRSADRAHGFAAEFGTERTHPDYAALIDDPGVDVVYVATHHPEHREWATRAADAGKHVLCEKPLAVNLAEAVAIVEAARRSGVFLMEAFAYRTHPQTHRLVQLLRDGAVGEIRMVDAVFGYDAGPRPSNYLLVRELAGGSILDVGCYTTSMAHLIARLANAGGVAEAVHVTGGASIGPSSGVDHSAAATLTFDGGLVARVASSVQVDLDSSLRIYGSEGRITVPSPWLPGRVGPRSAIILERRGSMAEEIEIQLTADLYAIEVDAVGAFIQEGQRSPGVMSWEESLANMHTLDRWRASVGLSYEVDEPSLEGAQAAASGRER